MSDDLFQGAMPKSEIQVLDFIKSHPEYDGRGTVIAIFDTGVDPGAAGLQRTSEGKPKILDLVDCTGSNDVDTSRIVKLDGDGTIPAAGNTSRRLKINPIWENPTGEWRVGWKAAYELFPGGLKSRMKEERKKHWQEQQRQALTAASAALSAHQKDFSGKLDDAQKKEREELEIRLQMLTDMAYEDGGPIIECVVWHDGSAWRVALDTFDLYRNCVDEDDDTEVKKTQDRGLLYDFIPMTHFRSERQWATLTAEDACNYAVNIYNNGDILSIVIDAGSHGTHVAGIATAFHPEDPQLNGMAPGAQIISCKIGDTRLGSMETGVGLTRAFISVLENKCDLINMSYGEATSTPNAGRFISLARELVYEHNVIFVASAGNAGPALSTVGAPGGTSSAIWGIGAFVTPQLAQAGHSVRGGDSTGDGLQYNWSSRGPTTDGSIGVTFSAPGGAVAPVPNWTQQRRQLMNGTSMASPNAAGGVAVLISAAKAEGQAVTPARIRRAIENTCLCVDPSNNEAAALTYGHGLLQVANAWEYLKQSASIDVPADLRYDVTVRRGDGTASGRGIYLREPQEAAVKTTHQCDIIPGLKEKSDILTERLAVEAKLKLKCTVSWVTAPELLLLPHNGRSFEIEINPLQLEEGVLHYAEVQAYDSTAEWRGPLVRVPITVIKPLNVMGSGAGEIPEAAFQLAFGPGKEQRRFVAIPEGSSWAEIRMMADETPTANSYMVRATQLLPQTRYSSSEYRTLVKLTAHQEHVASFAVIPGGTLELTVAQFWNSFNASSATLEVSFHGITIPSHISLDGAVGGVKIIARAPLRREKLKPVVKLDTLRVPLRPMSTELAPMNGDPHRDVLPRLRTVYKLVLEYTLSVTESGGKWSFKLPALNRYVYDAPLEAQMVMVFDANKQLLGVGDIYPLDKLDLKKGNYTIRIMLRHDESAILEKLKTLTVVAERSLGDNAVTVPVYGSASDSLLGANAVSKDRSLYPNEKVALFLGPVSEDKLPKDALPGRVLTGTCKLGVLGRVSTGTNGSSTAPGGASITYIVPPAPSKKPENSISGPLDPGKQGSSKRLLEETIRDAQVKFLGEMKTESEEDKELYGSLQEELKASYPTHLPLLLEPLKRSKTAVKGAIGDNRIAILDSMVAAADEVIAAINTDELAIYTAQKCPEEGPEAAENKRVMEERKNALIMALSSKCYALLEIGGNDGDASFESTFKDLKKWTDPSAETEYALFLSKREEKAGRLASAIKALEKVASPEDKPAPRDVLERRAELFAKLGWQHWTQQEVSKIRKAFSDTWPLS